MLTLTIIVVVGWGNFQVDMLTLTIIVVVNCEYIISL